MIFEDWAVAGFNRPAAVRMTKSGINPLAAVILSSRGLTDPAAAGEILSEDSDILYDPFDLDDMDIAVTRINKAIKTGEKITIFGDYDVDGMTSSVLVKTYLQKRGVNADIYIPGRSDEGYGLNKPALDSLREGGSQLIITVDCGITAVAEVSYGNSIGLDFVITDHHECREVLPDAAAVVDPKRPDSTYKNRVLAGVGVAFKLICALESETDGLDLLYEFGDLVAVGTVADVMPVTGENRTLIRRGLKRLREAPRPGLLSLMRIANTPQHSLNTASIGFSLAPRLNAAGRMGMADLSVKILLTESEEEADRLTGELVKLNDMRRELESKVFDEVVERIGTERPKGPIVISGRGWFQGVMGIVAARTSEKYMLPALIICIDDDDIGRGSCRSFGEFRLHTAIGECSDLLLNFGGHEMAAGVTIEASKIPEFEQRMTEAYRRQITTSPHRTLKVDLEVEKPELISIENVSALEKLEPFGNGNPPPCLTISAARVQQITPVGAGKHTRIRIEKNRKALDCIFFSQSPEDLNIVEGGAVDIAFEPQINEFREKRAVQLHLFDIRPHNKGRESIIPD